MTAAPVLEVVDLARAFGGMPAVDGVAFSVGEAEIVALIGPNGAGKTTTFNLINGQLRPDRGCVRLAGRDVTGFPPRALWREGVARTFQITATFASMTVAENIAVAVMAREHPRAVWRSVRRLSLQTPECRSLLHDTGLEPLSDRVCGTLAYGDLKRVEVAVALAARPRLLLMDEPTAGVAASERLALMAHVVAVARRRGAAILFIEHDMALVFQHASRVLVMSGGRLIAAGTPAEVRADPSVRQAYLGDAVSSERAP